MSESNEAGECEEMVINLTDHKLPSWAEDKYIDHGLGFSLASDGEAIMVSTDVVFADRWIKMDTINMSSPYLCRGSKFSSNHNYEIYHTFVT